MLRPPHAKSWLIGKDSDAGRDWGQEETGMTEDEMAWWHHWVDGRESEWTPGVGDGQGSLACCDSWGRKESDTIERLNRTEMNWWCSSAGKFGTFRQRNIISTKQKWACKTWKDMEEAWMYITKGKKPTWKSYCKISTIGTFWKRQNSGDSEKISGCQTC